MLSDTTRCRVITIASTDGAQAGTIGRRVATELGFRYMDDQIVERAVELTGVTPADVAAVEHSQSLIARILTSLALSAASDPSGVGPVAEAVPTPVTQTVVYETRRCEFVARAAVRHVV
jgi:cytidylate kinase